jgi:large subunit ribosomal protein L21
MSFIIQSGSKQFIVNPGQEVIVDRLPQEEGSQIELDLVLAFGDDVKAKKVTGTIKRHQKGKKIRVVKYKSKSNYHKVSGHRDYQTVIEINS